MAERNRRRFASALMAVSESSLASDRAERDATGYGVPIVLPSHDLSQGYGRITDGGIGDAAEPEPRTLAQQVAEVEARAITEALAATHGSRKDAATRLGIGLRTLFYKMRQLGMNGGA